MSDPRTIAVLGTGIMGGPMAVNLARAGHRVRAWNRSADKAAALSTHGVMAVPTASQACRGAEIALVMLSDGPTCDRVLFEPDATGTAPASALDAGAIILVMSSIPVPSAEAQAARCAALGLRYVDAPVSGGEVGAKAATLAIFAGGEPDTLAEIEPVLRCLGRPSRIGPAGTGSLAKLCNQVIVGITIGAVAEAMLLAKAGGADPAALRSALMGGFADSRILDLHGARMARRDWRPGGPSKHQLKDMRTAAAQGRALGLDLPLTGLVEALYADLVANGQGDLDHSALLLELARRSGAAGWLDDMAGDTLA